MKIGHVHLKVRDLQHSISFYERYLGLKVTERAGEGFAFMSGTSMHHEVALQAVGPQAETPGRHDVGLYHVAFEVPDREAFASVYRRLVKGGEQVYPVNHRISWALYFNDPDGNGLEVYLDTRQTAGGTEVWEGINLPLREADLVA